MAYLVVLKGQNAKQSISLDKDRVVLGRNATCDVVFPANDFAVSREHACIVRVQGKFFVEDLGSRLPKIVESLFQLYKQADRGFIILREETIERDKPVERLIPKVIKTRRAQDESSTSYSRSIVRECLKTVAAFLSDDASQDKR